MKKPTTPDEVRTQVGKMLGHNVTLRVNKGRNRVHMYNGKVSEVHANVFVVQLFDDLFDRLSCSYVDVACGEVRIKEA